MKRRYFIAGASAAAASLVWGLDRTRGDAAAAEEHADDTARLQAALNRGGHVTLERGRRYRVRAPAGAKTALVINSDTFLDLAGAILELAPSQHCSLIATPGGGRNRNIRISGGDIVGNGKRQPVKLRPSVGITPTFYLMNVERLELRDLQMRDTYMYAVYAQGDDGTVANLKIENAIGGGIHLNGSRWRIGKVNVRNVTFFDPVNCTGNPFIVSLRDSKVDSVQCENYGFGVKFQDGCENVTVNSILAIGGDNNFKNGDFLVKIQGMNDSRGKRLNRGIRIGSIVARNGPNTGLYIIHSDGVDIASYQGENNGRLQQKDAKYGADVLIIASDNVHFGALRVQGYSRHGLWIHDKVGRFTADTVDIGGAKEIGAVPMVFRSGSVVIGGKRVRGAAS